jgi:hypothetical protein
VELTWTSFSRPWDTVFEWLLEQVRVATIACNYHKRDMATMLCDTAVILNLAMDCCTMIIRGPLTLLG